MRTSKFKFLIPVLAIAFAVTSAFTTSAKSEIGHAAPINGYVDYPTPCMTPPIQCLDEGTVTCTNELEQPAYGKWSESATTCPRLVFRE